MINEVLDVMVALAKEGMTMMVVTHEMGFARKVAPRVVFMDSGEIVEDAPTSEFFGKCSGRLLHGAAAPPMVVYRAGRKTWGRSSASR
jgi:ABC-type polar amino acid transport system ATPase subunit